MAVLDRFHCIIYFSLEMIKLIFNCNYWPQSAVGTVVILTADPGVISLIPSLAPYFRRLIMKYFSRVTLLLLLIEAELWSVTSKQKNVQASM